MVKALENGGYGSVFKAIDLQTSDEPVRFEAPPLMKMIISRL